MSNIKKTAVAMATVSAMLLGQTGAAYSHQTGYGHQHDNSSAIVFGIVAGAIIGAVVAGSVTQNQQQHNARSTPPPQDNWNDLMNRPWRWDYYRNGTVEVLATPIRQWHAGASQYVSYRYRAPGGELYRYCTQTNKSVACAY